MPKNRIAGHRLPQDAPAWGKESKDDIDFLDWPLVLDPRGAVEHGHEVDFWDAVGVWRRNELERRIDTLEYAALSMRGAIYPIDSLIPGRVIVEKTIHAQVIYEDGCHVATFVDANINASGESELDAIEMLKDAIASTFLAFSEREHILGDEPARQLAVLREFVRSA